MKFKKEYKIVYPEKLVTGEVVSNLEKLIATLPIGEEVQRNQILNRIVIFIDFLLGIKV
jgi:hypothetical protein